MLVSHYQISYFVGEAISEPSSSEALLPLVNRILEPRYLISNFGAGFQDGIALCSLVEAQKSGAIDIKSLDPANW